MSKIVTQDDKDEIIRILNRSSRVHTSSERISLILELGLNTNEFDVNQGTPRDFINIFISQLLGQHHIDLTKRLLDLLADNVPVEEENITAIKNNIELTIGQLEETVEEGESSTSESIYCTIQIKEASVRKMENDLKVHEKLWKSFGFEKPSDLDISVETFAHEYYFKLQLYKVKKVREQVNVRNFNKKSLKQLKHNLLGVRQYCKQLVNLVSQYSFFSSVIDVDGVVVPLQKDAQQLAIEITRIKFNAICRENAIDSRKEKILIDLEELNLKGTSIN